MDPRTPSIPLGPRGGDAWDMSVNALRPQGPVVPAFAAERPIDPGLRIGHVHLRTADIDRVRAFYVGVMGFDVVMEARDVPGWGTTGDILFLSAGGYHHHLGFNTWKSKGGPSQPDGVTGLHHVALNFSTRAQLAETVQRLVDAGVALRQLTDHGTHQAVYLSDPDGNDLELAWDRPFDQWPDFTAENADQLNRPLDLDDLLAAAAARD
jgi:catechol 2,3-dioxygenase